MEFWNKRSWHLSKDLKPNRSTQFLKMSKKLVTVYWNFLFTGTNSFKKIFGRLSFEWTDSFTLNFKSLFF